MCRSFLIVGCGLPFEKALATALAEFGATALVQLGVFRDSVLPPVPQLLVNERWVYPPGFNGKLAWIFNRSIEKRIERMRHFLLHESSAWPYVLTSYPKFGKYLRGVASRHIVYYNQDDNSAYDVNGSSFESVDERALVRQAGMILCASLAQTERFRRRVSDATLVSHLPHGVQDHAINPHPQRRGMAVLVLGGLSYRYNWELIRHVVSALPDAGFLFVGQIDVAGMSPSSRTQLTEVLRSPNVVHRPLGNEQETAALAWDAAVHWLPYDPVIPFNAASCPLKLYTGLASGRPVVSSRVPECELHSRWVTIYDTALQAISALKSAIAEPTNEADRRGQDQILFARANTWRVRAHALVALLDRRDQVA
jgi:teichuronic acid biosynthesis glycosyltransferase TuaH